jgi:dynein heavy chain
MAELTKLAGEARDNVKFLATLERHFKSITSGPLAGIVDTLPPLMNALRMVWIISKHYSDDARMGGLFERIAGKVGDRVERAIDLAQIFKVPAQEAVALISTAKVVAEQWYTTYMQVRGQAVQTVCQTKAWHPVGAGVLVCGWRRCWKQWFSPPALPVEPG